MQTDECVWETINEPLCESLRGSVTKISNGYTFSSSGAVKFVYHIDGWRVDESNHPANSIKFILYVNGVAIVHIEEGSIGSGYSTSAITSEISVTKGQSVTWDFSTDGYISVGHCDVFLIG